MLNRVIDKEINHALKISPAVLVAGARQIGKSTGADPVMTYKSRCYNYIVLVS